MTVSVVIASRRLPASLNRVRPSALLAIAAAKATSFMYQSLPLRGPRASRGDLA